MEVWKDVPEFEGLYQVSNLGRVKSLKFNKERILKAADNGNGYCFVNLFKNKRPYAKRVHQLVAIAFLDHELNGHGLVVDHKNNIRTDNRVENLQIITHRKNSSKDKKNKSSQYTGVSWHKPLNKWFSQIQINGKAKYLGLFTDEYQAHLAYKEQLNKYE